jgi:L-seryl-tRNA(Ser) seleniumtransferase
LVTFSGDKLLGGPQAGIIAGRADLVAACARHPLARALRPGGLVLGALQATALAYLDRRGDDIPLWRMVARSVDDLRARAEAIGIGTVIDTVTVAGGGTLPGTEIESVGIAVDGDQRRGLRLAPVPVIARMADGRTVLDLRTVEPDQDVLVAAALAGLPGGG